MNITKLKSSLPLVLFFFCMAIIYGQTDGKSSSGIYMSVSGRVINCESGKGLPDVEIVIRETSTGSEYKATSERDGFFEISKVPEGMYEIDIWSIHLTCPEELVLEKEPEEFKVNKGGNVVGLAILLREGASVSGRVFGPDGKTPITNGHVVVHPRLKGKTIKNILDKQGRYKVVGLVSLRKEEDEYYVIIRSVGFSNLIKTLPLKNGEKVENYDVAIGKGEIHIKGTIRSLTTNEPIKGAEVYVLDVERNRLDRSDGSAMADENGNYSIIGFSNSGTVEISIIHEDYKMKEDVRKSLKRGINTFEFKLEPKSKEKSMESDSFFFRESNQSESKSESDGIIFENCCDHDKDMIENFFIKYSTCPTINGDKGDKCVNNKRTLECMREKCKNKLFEIKCDYKCRPDPRSGKIPCATTSKYNSKAKRSKMKICFNAMKDCFPMEIRIFHELFHHCDRDADPNFPRGYEDPCAEARAYAAQLCAFDKSKENSKRKYKEYKEQCIEVHK